MSQQRKKDVGNERTARPAVRFVLVVLLPILCLLPCQSGCRNCHLVEAELRKQETENRKLCEELDRVKAVNEGLMLEVHGVHAAAIAAAPRVTPEQASQVYGLREIVLGRGTGGYDDDTHSGDVGIELVLEPRDPDGHTIKAPGSLQVTALEIRPDGNKAPLSTWEVPPDKLRPTWKSGFISTGYFVILPWQRCPTSNKLRIVAHFTLADGRSFETDKDVTIKPPKQPQPPPPAEGPVPEVPPMPRPNPAPGLQTRKDTTSASPILPASWPRPQAATLMLPQD